MILWVQLVLGLITLPFSWAALRRQRDAGPRRLGAAHRHVARRSTPTRWPALPWPYMFHIVLGMTIFLLFPFSRLVHVWSGFASVGYLFRPYQVVRSRRLNVPAGHNSAAPPGVGD